jgi:hypothetical protein
MASRDRHSQHFPMLSSRRLEAGLSNRFISYGIAFPSADPMVMSPPNIRRAVGDISGVPWCGFSGFMSIDDVLSCVDNGILRRCPPRGFSLRCPPPLRTGNAVLAVAGQEGALCDGDLVRVARVVSHADLSKQET